MLVVVLVKILVRIPANFLYYRRSVRLFETVGNTMRVVLVDDTDKSYRIFSVEDGR